MGMEADFHEKDFAPRLALIKGVKGLVDISYVLLFCIL